MSNLWMGGKVNSAKARNEIFLFSDPITSWAKLKNICAILILLFALEVSVQARDSFEFKIGDKIQILSDKAFRKTQEEKFEAIGNVIINHQNMAIYGEKASISFKTGESRVIGNVRYVAPDLTLYGSELVYNFKTKTMVVKNARGLSENFVILGKKITKTSDGEILAEDAEYSTCRDCPESWSVFGKNVRITVGEYIRIWHAYIKVKGVIAMYFPYILFPIKKERESGLLFPSFGFEFEEGFRFQQPWFWAISKSSDLTLTPSIFGKRGYANILEYRKKFYDKAWVEFDSLQSWDRIYAPGKISNDLTGRHEFRNFSTLEYHVSTSENFNHHTYISELNDLDTIRDFNIYTDDKVFTPETGVDSFLEFRTSLTNITTETYFKKNQLTRDPKGFDHNYVQIFPKVNLDTVPVNILQTKYPVIKKISFGLDSDYTVFRQNHRNEDPLGQILNTERINVSPYMNWEFGSIGPVQFRNRTTYEHQRYKLPTRGTSEFKKYGIVYESEASLSLYRNFGLSYIETHDPSEVVVTSPTKRRATDYNLIGGMVVNTAETAKDQYEVRKSSYRHAIDLKLKHFLISDQKTEGNNSFLQQISADGGDGQFDYVDAIKSKEHLISDVEKSTSIPKRNSIELQWNNSLIKKSSKLPIHLNSPKSYLNQEFDYSRIAYFDVSQGVDFDAYSKDDSFSDKLTRLAISLGASNSKYSVSVNEYYFYQSHKHILSFDLRRSFGIGYVSGNYRYNKNSSPVKKTLGLSTELNPISLIGLGLNYDYDIENKQKKLIEYDVTYKPTNKCWMLNFNYKRTPLDNKISFNFMINFNNNNFTSFNE